MNNPHIPQASNNSHHFKHTPSKSQQRDRKLWDALPTEVRKKYLMGEEMDEQEAAAIAVLLGWERKIACKVTYWERHGGAQYYVGHDPDNPLVWEHTGRTFASTAKAAVQYDTRGN